MSNKYSEHLHVLPEDDANRQLANGLQKNLDVDARRLHVLPPAAGWRHVLDRLTDRATIQGMLNYHQRHLLLLIDFDNLYRQRLEMYLANKATLPLAVSERVFLLGCLHEPEQLKAACNRRPLEQLGLELSKDCDPAPTNNLWQHQHLQHNASELARLVAQAKPFLFKTP